MTTSKDYVQRLLSARAVVDDADDFYTQDIPILGIDSFLMSYDATIAFSGGSSPGLKFTVEADTTGQGNWVAVTTLVATGNGYSADAVADPTITSTGKVYRVYNHPVAGTRLRVKVEVTGAPTGGTATINSVVIVGEYR